MAMPAPSTDKPPSPRTSAVRMFGRLQLLRLLGKSDRSMAWHAAEPQDGQELVLVLPRVQPPDAAALQYWQGSVRQAARLDHPNLMPVFEVGVQDGWPYVAYKPGGSSPLSERTLGKGLPATEAARAMHQALRGLAFAHEAGVAHHDLQPFLIFCDESGAVRVAGLATACEMAAKADAARQAAGAPVGDVQRRSAATQRDVLAAGLILHSLCAGAAPLDETDTGRVIERLAPLGRDIVRLPWSVPQPISDALRAIVNRASDRQERQRYRNARTLLGALEGWLRTDSESGAGPIALLADRLRTAGVLPSTPGGAVRAARLARMDRERTNELAEVVLQDPALAFELLRLVNSAQVRATQAAGGGPVVTVRRAIAMMGLDGVRRAALVLRPWPGPLNEAGAAELERLMAQCKRAAGIALALRPAGYDGEVVYLLTLMQNLGRLIVQYHFADEAEQIRRLMQPAPSTREGETEDPGMSEEGAAFAVLGTDIEAIGAAVARQWGLDDNVLTMIRRLPTATAVRSIEGDDTILRSVASCANEVVDALQLPPPKVSAALARVVQRYGRALAITLRDVQGALQASPGSIHGSIERGPQDPDPPPTETEPRRRDASESKLVDAPARAAVPDPSTAPGQGLRARAAAGRAS